MTTVKLSHLVDFEEKFELFGKSINGVSIWPLIRYQYIQSVLDHYNEFDMPQEKNKKHSLGKMLKYIIQTINFSPDRVNQAKNIDYLFFAKGTYKQINGKFYNRITEPYAELFPTKSLMIEESYNFNYAMPRTFKNIKFLDLYLIKTQLLVKLFRLEKKHVSFSKEFINFIKDNSPYKLPEEKWRHIEIFLCSQLARYRLIEKSISRLIRNVNPKVIFVEEACYGNRAFIVKLARSMGIKTVELQHGFIGATHPAYNYGVNSLVNTKEHCPDYILTYGDYWKKSITVPSNVVSIGNPSLEKTVNSFQGAFSKKLDVFRLLVISSGVDYKKLVELISKLVEQNNEIEIVFRAHPLERPVMNVRYNRLIRLGIKMSTVDLYDDIANCSLVFGEFSTALYEAMAFNKKVVMLENRYSKQYVSKEDALTVLDYVETADELDEIILNVKNEDECSKLDGVWESNWEKNYHEFISTIVND